MEETKTEKSVLYKHFSLYHDHNSSSNLSQRAIAHEFFEPFFTIGRAKRTKASKILFLLALLLLFTNCNENISS